ncbi:MAG: dTMP kinase [Proteobacteria bacterium]|nr:dTMP kinase [Pseudomonadota bacterium]
MVAGRFITLEGDDGSGKSTQIAMLSARLREAGHEVVVTRDPGGTEGAEAIRNLVLTGDPDRWDAITSALLHFAARRDYVERLIRPALERGQWVISDRFADSTIVYQGVAGGAGADAIRDLWQTAIGGFKPDLTLIIDLPVAEGLERANGRMQQIEDETSREDRYEKMGAGFHKIVRQAFLDIAEEEPRRCALIDGTENPDDVHARIWAAVSDRLL